MVDEEIDIDAGAVTVLIVDDEDDQRMLLRRYFERAGCDVREAASAGDGTIEFERAVPDLAVIDLLIPGMNGWELAATLTERYPESTIAITSVLDPEVYPKTHAALPKPVSGDAVRRLLEEHVPKWANQ